MLDAVMGETPNPGEWERKAGGNQSPLMTRECRTAEGLVFITDFVLPVFGCLEKARAMEVNMYGGGSRTGSTEYSAKKALGNKFYPCLHNDKGFYWTPEMQKIALNIGEFFLMPAIFTSRVTGFLFSLVIVGSLLFLEHRYPCCY